MINLFVVDNFYPKPYELREFALKQDFNVDGNYPGHRTCSFLRDIDYQLGTGFNPNEIPNYQSTIMQRLADIVRPFAGEVTWWGDEIESGGYTGASTNTLISSAS